MGMFKRTYKLNEQPVRSNQPSDRPAQSILHHLFTFPRYSSLCYRTIQANPPSDLPSIHNHFWTQHPFTRGLLRTITCMDYGGNHVLRTVSDSQPAVVGIDGPMLIIYMHRFPLCTCLVMRKLFELYMLYQTCVLTFTFYVLTFILTYVTGG
ncbi:hypothetical protein Hanom_Chr02g00103521 [Helianthus anomalus]